jgi:hypothetical protein
MDVNKISIGDRIQVDCIEGFGGPARVVELRDFVGSRCKVEMEDGSQSFWAHDFEIHDDPPPPKPYDSRHDTHKHIRQVQSIIGLVIADLQRRAAFHDRSKLGSPEVEFFDEFTPKLAGTTYGSDEYRSYLAAMKPGLDHHYRENSHHPEHYADGILGMSLLDLIEMLCDWAAAVNRHNDGNLRRSIEINQSRFGYGDDLKRIFLNTVPFLESDTLSE